MITKNAVFTRVKNAITTEYPSANVVSKRVQTPSEFPTVWVVEMDSYPKRENLDFNLTNDSRVSTFEIQSFSNNSDDPEGEAETIINIAIEAMRQCGYICMSNTQVDNGYDVSIGRHVARFTRTIGNNDVLPTV